MEKWNEFLDQDIHDSFFDLPPPQLEETNIVWSFEENRQFENALVEFLDPSSPTFFENLASRVPSKLIEDVKNHYQALVEDIDMIDSGLIEPPEYKDDQCDLKAAKNGPGSSSNQQKRIGSQRKRRGVPWTEEEHRAFLKGVNKCGKGDWRRISRFFVVTKTPTQVASHAQKYFRRLQTSTPAKRRRPSINDIQNVTSSTPTSTTTISVTVPQQDHVNPQQGEDQIPLPNSFPHNNMTFPSPITTTTTISIPPYNHMNAQRTKQPISHHSSFSYNNIDSNLEQTAMTFTTSPNPETSTMMHFSSSSSTSTLNKTFWWVNS